VTCPSPARTTLPSRRTDKTVVDLISRFVDMSAIFDYSSRPSVLLSTRFSSAMLLRTFQRALATVYLAALGSH
jgi:hypothetical protein